jgi:hypothetical protein
MPSDAHSNKLPLVLNPNEIPIPSKIIALCGRAAELHPLVLQSLCAIVARSRRVGVVVGDNRFDEFRLARYARAQGLDPAAILQRIIFSRPFTCHQLHHGVLNLDAEKMKAWDAFYVLGLLDTFWDEDIRYPDAVRLLQEIIARLKQFALDGLPILVTLSPPPVETTRVQFITRVLAAADGYWAPAPLEIEPASPQMAMW